MGRRVLVALLVILWAAFGFVFGAYWLVLGLASRRSSLRSTHSSFSSSSSAPRHGLETAQRSYFSHFIFFIVCLAITAAGGGWARSDGAYDCPGNVTMTRECIYTTQSTTYQIIYVLHYISLGTGFALGAGRHTTIHVVQNAPGCRGGAFSTTLLLEYSARRKQCLLVHNRRRHHYHNADVVYRCGLEQSKNSSLSRMGLLIIAQVAAWEPLSLFSTFIHRAVAETKPETRAALDAL